MSKALSISVILSAIDRLSPVINGAVGRANAALNTLSAKAGKMGDKSLAFGQNAAMVGIGLGASLAAPIKAAMEFETGMTNVRKVVDGLKEPEAFKAYGKQVLELGRTLPIAYSEITDLVAAGGRMGIPKEQLMDYTKEVAKMATAFDMAAGEIGEKMGKLGVMFKIPVKDIGGLADAINYLDDNSISKGSEIIDVLGRVAGTANQLGMSAQQAAALGSTFLTLGSSAEVAGTASTAMLRELSIASMKTKEAQAAIREVGFDPQQLEKAMAKDSQGTLLKFLDALNKVPKDKIISIGTKIFGKEYGDDAAKLASGVDEYRRQIGLLSKTEVKGSMSREFEARLNTSAAQMALFKNNLTELSVTIGNALLPALNSVMAAVRPYVAAFQSWAEANPQLVSAIASTAAGLAALSVGVAGASFLFGGLLKSVSMISTVLGLGTTGLSRFGKAAIWVYGAMTNLVGSMVASAASGGVMAKVLRVLAPLFKVLSVAIGFVSGALKFVWALMMANPIIAICVAIGAAVYIIYQYWEPISEFFVNLWEGIKTVFWGFIDWLGGFGSYMYDAGVNLMTSMWEGLKSMLGKVKDTIAAPFEWAGSWFGGSTPEATSATGAGLGSSALSGTFFDKALSGGTPQPLPMPAQGSNVKSTSSLMFSPNVTINGDISPEQQKKVEDLMGTWGLNIMRNFKEQQRLEDRKKY